MMPSTYKRTLTGSQFNELYKDQKFVKLTNENECHNNFQYKDGLNVDTIKFNPTGLCQPGGLYFYHAGMILITFSLYS